MNPFLTTLTPLVAQATDGMAQGVGQEYRYRLFLGPLPVWDYWPWLIVPLAVAVAVVYKSIKCHRMSQVPREATILTLWIVGGMAAVAGALAAIVKLVEVGKS